MSAKLVLLGEDGENPPAGLPAFFLLTENRTTIGRSRSADITCDSQAYPCTLSRTHVIITREKICNGEYLWHVTDSETMNGTFIGCVKVHESTIGDGEILTLGGGAGLGLGERSDMLASDLVFRFEVMDNDDNDDDNDDDDKNNDDNSNSNSNSNNGDDDDDDEKGRHMLERQGDGGKSGTPTAAGRHSPNSNSAPPRPPISMSERLLCRKDDKQPTSSPPLVPMGEVRSRRTTASSVPRHISENPATLPVSVGSSSSSSSTTSTSTSTTTTDSRQANSKKDNDDHEEKMAAARRLMHESMMAEVKCAVCCDFFLNACTLTCSHSFCTSCIEECLYRKHECPVCRAPVATRPVRSNHLDNIVQTLMNMEEKKDWGRRQAQQTAKQERQAAAVASLQLRLADASASESAAFLNIDTEWTSNQRTTFETGVNQYRGDARKLYCDATGLTNNFLESAPQEQLLLAGVNIGIIPLEEAGGFSPGELRRKLQMFIMFGLKPSRR